MEEQKSHSSGFVIGVIVGAAAALFLTSKRGKDLLAKAGKEGEEILSELEHLFEEGKQTVEKARKHLTPFEKEVEEKVHERVTHAKEAIEAVVEKLDNVKDSPLGEKATEVLSDLKKLELVETAQEKLEDVKETLLAETKPLKRRFFKRSSKKTV